MRRERSARDLFSLACVIGVTVRLAHAAAAFRRADEHNARARALVRAWGLA